MSSIKPIKIEDATPAQLRAFATSFLNLDVSPAASDAEIVQVINAASPGTSMIFIEDTGEAEEITRIDPPFHGSGPEAVNADRVVGSLGRGDPRCLIRIMPIQTDDGVINDDVAVGVNGRIWQLKRGEDLDVPWRVAEALGLSVQDVIRHDDEGNVIQRQVDRIPMTILRRPSAEEVLEWQRTTADSFCP